MKYEPSLIDRGVVRPAATAAPARPVSPPEQLQRAFSKELLEFGPAVFLYDSQGEIRWSNAAFRRLADTRIPGGTVGQALPLRDIAEAIDLDRQAVFREDALPSGQMLRSRHVPLFTADGRLDGFGCLVNLASEISDKVDDATLALERHMDFIRLGSDWMWETDPSFSLRMVTHRVNSVLGVTPHELIGRNLLELIASEPLRQAVKQKLEKLTPFRDQHFDAVDNNGRRKLFLMSAVPVFDKADGSLKGYRGSAADITELTRREESLRSAKETAEVASRSKSQFLAAMSHELRTPLNAIIGFADVMRMGLLGPVENDEYRGYVKDIHSSALHLLGIINDILDVSRIETGAVDLQESAVNTEELVNSASRLVRERLDAAGHKMTIDLPPRLPRLNVDKRKMKQVLVNLLTNAIKFTPAGGRIRIAAGIGDHGGVEFTVEDNGVGIDPAHVERLMEPFAQADAGLDRRFEGVGLGLPLCRGLVRLHGGDLLLESERGIGTRAIVRIPAQRSIEGSHLTAVK